MGKKIIDIKTVSTSNEESDKNNAWYEYSFNGQVEKLLKEGYVPYDQVQVSFSGSTKSVTGGENSGIKYLTQQFVMYEDYSGKVLTGKIKKGHILLCIEGGKSTNGNNEIRKFHKYIATKDADDGLGFESVRVEGGGETDWDTKRFIIIA